MSPTTKAAHTADLPTRCCGRCRMWTRRNPDDMTAPEGRCGNDHDAGHYPFGYWPSTLQRDKCPAFSRIPAEARANV